MTVTENDSHTKSRLELFIWQAGPEGKQANQCNCAVPSAGVGSKARDAAIEILAEMGLIFRIIPKGIKSRGYARWVHRDFAEADELTQFAA